MQLFEIWPFEIVSNFGFRASYFRDGYIQIGPSVLRATLSHPAEGLGPRRSAQIREFDNRVP